VIGDWPNVGFRPIADIQRCSHKSRMVRNVVWSVLYWFAAALVLVGLIVMLGDCGTAVGEVQQCAEGQRQVFWTAVLLAIAIYAFLVWRRYRSRPHR
jgi:hypothetical protein